MNSRSIEISATGAECESVVRGPLAVDHHSSRIGEGLAIPEADLLEDMLRQVFGRDHHRVHWQQKSLASTKRSGIGLRGTHDHVGSQAATIRNNDTVFDRARRRAFVDRHTHALDDIREAAHQAHRVHRCAVREEEATQVLCRPDASPTFLGLEPTNVIFTEPEFTPERDVGAYRIDLRRCERERDVATQGPVTIDLLAFADTLDFPDRVEDRTLKANSCIAPRPIAFHEF